MAVCHFNKYTHPHTHTAGKDVWSALPAEYVSTGYGCHSRSWSAEQGECFFTCPRLRLRISSCETGLAVPSCSFSTLNLARIHGISPTFRDGVHLHSQLPLGQFRVYQAQYLPTDTTWHSPPRVHRHRAGSPQGSLSTGCCLFRRPH